MIFAQVTDAEMRAVQVFTGLTMAGFIGARTFGSHSQRARMVIGGIYIAGILGLIVYALL